MSETETNLLAAFAGESQARNKYIFYAKMARKEGLHYIADIFSETARHEEQHAKNLYNLFDGIGDTASNLRQAIAGEEYEANTMYPEFAETAQKEGHKEAAFLFKQLAKVEAHHRDCFQHLLNKLENNTLFTRETAITWKCIKCGWVTEATEPPEQCPACKHSTNYFEPSDI